MWRRLILTVIFACIGSFPVHAGDTFMNGPVSGIWYAGQRVIVDGRLWVPAGEELQIDQGVYVHFLTLDSVVIDGRLTTNGQNDRPVIFSVPNGWAGLQFPADSQNIHKLTGLQVGTEGGLPLRVIKATKAQLELNYCLFVAQDVCLDVEGGQVHASHNHFKTTGLTSRAVRLQNLHPTSFFEPSTFMCSNWLEAIVPDNGQPPLGQTFTAALDVSNCSQLTLDSLFIVVEAPCMAVGANFSYESSIGTEFYGLNRSTVTVHSPSGQSYGLLGTKGGTLSVIHCTIDVSCLEGNPHRPSGVFHLGRGGHDCQQQSGDGGQGRPLVCAAPRRDGRDPGLVR